MSLLSGLHDGSLDIALTYSLDLTEDIAFTPLLSLPPYAILPRRTAWRARARCRSPIC